MGAPEGTADLDGQTRWTHQIGKSGRKMTYVFDAVGTLHDAIYTDGGPYTGLTAR